jgi:hypothetical protein
MKIGVLVVDDRWRWVVTQCGGALKRQVAGMTNWSAVVAGFSFG